MFVVFAAYATRLEPMLLIRLSAKYPTAVAGSRLETGSVVPMMTVLLYEAVGVDDDEVLVELVDVVEVEDVEMLGVVVVLVELFPLSARTPPIAPITTITMIITATIALEIAFLDDIGKGGFLLHYQLFDEIPEPPPVSESSCENSRKLCAFLAL